MTNEEAIAGRYAQAIFDLGIEVGDPQALADEIARFASAVGESAELQSVAGSPLIDRAAVEAVVVEVAGRLRLSRLAQNAIGLMARRRRLLLVALVAEELSRLADQRAGVVRATVASAAPLSEAYCQRLIAALEKSVGKKVLLERAVDPSLVAGVVTRIGDQVIDGSARARLAFIQSELLTTANS